MRAVNAEHERRLEALARFERATQLPLLILALLTIPLFLSPFVLDMPAGQERVIFALDWLIWGVFAADLLIRTRLAPHKLSYLRRHWFDVLIVVLPFLRPLRVARSASALRVLGVVRALAYVVRAAHATQAILGRRGVQGSLLFAGLVLTASAIANLLRRAVWQMVEIDGLDTAFWWAIHDRDHRWLWRHRTPSRRWVEASVWC